MTYLIPALILGGCGVLAGLLLTVSGIDLLNGV